jgi:predicted ATPase
MLPAIANLWSESHITLYGRLEARATAFLLTGYDPGMALLSFLSHVLWYLGYPDQALQKSREAVTLASELCHPYSLAFALSFATRLHQFRRERHATQEQAEALRALASAQGFAFFLSHALILRGWGLPMQEPGEERIAQIRQGIAAYRATGAELERSHWLALLAERCGQGGQAEEGLHVLAEALAAVHTTGEHFYEAEIYRLKGEILWRQAAGREHEAEACLHQALDVAHRQEAKALELRATMSLSRLWQQQGKRAKARELLAPIYGWFTEGFDTADLQEAKALLDELGA